MTSKPMIEYPSVPLASKVLDCVDNLRNAVITDQSVNEILTSIRELVDCSNAKSLKEFPVDVVCKQSNTLLSEIKSWYHPDLNQTNIRGLIVSTFGELDIDSSPMDASTRCIDALRVLADYINVAVLLRKDCCLELQSSKKKIDELQSSSSVEKSIHLVNDDDFYG